MQVLGEGEIMITGYLTKYALTDGIQEITGELKTISGTEYFALERTIYGARHWSPTLTEAKAVVLKMIEKKRISIAKELNKLEALEKEMQP